MDSIVLLEELRELIEKATTIPFTGYSLINKAIVLQIINEAKEGLPRELTQAEKIKEQRQAIIENAKKEAERFKKEAQKIAVSMIDDNEIHRLAIEKGEEIIRKAKIKCDKINYSIEKYASDLLSKAHEAIISANDTLVGLTDEIKDNMDSLRHKDNSTENAED